MNLVVIEINKYFLNDYLNKLTISGLNKNTLKLHFTIIKGFLTFIADSELEKFGYLKFSMDDIKIKTEQKEKESFTQTEQKQLLNYVAKLDLKQNYLAQRNALLIKVLLYTGAKISELINIQWEDIAEHYDETPADLSKLRQNLTGRF